MKLKYYHIYTLCQSVRVSVLESKSQFYNRVLIMQKDIYKKNKTKNLLLEF